VRPVQARGQALLWARVRPENAALREVGPAVRDQVELLERELLLRGEHLINRPTGDDGFRDIVRRDAAEADGEDDAHAAERTPGGPEFVAAAPGVDSGLVGRRVVCRDP